LLAAITGAAVWQIQKLDFDISVFAIFDSEGPEFQRMWELEKEFEVEKRGALIVIALKKDDLFTPEGIALVEKISAGLDAIEGTGKVISLTRVPDMSSPERLVGGLTLFEGRMDHPEEMARAKEFVLNNPLYSRLLVSREGDATAIAATLPLIDVAGGPEEWQRRKAVTDARALVKAVRADTGAEIYLSGPPIIGYEYARQLKRDFAVFLVLCTLLLVLILFWIFRNIRGVVLPAVTVLSAAGWTVALMAVMGQPVNMINSSLPVLVMVIGCADSIHILRRYTEDLGDGLEKRVALQKTFKRIGIAVFLTSITSAIGFLSLSTSSSNAVARLGEFAAAGIMFAYIFSISFIPSALMMLRPGPSMPVPDKDPDLFDRFLSLVVRADVNRPGWVLASGALVVALSVAGIMLLKTDSRMLQELSERSPFARSTRFIEEHLGGVMDASVIVEAPKVGGVLEPAFLQGLWKLQEFMDKKPEIGSSVSLASYLVSMNNAFRGGYEVPASEKDIAQYLFLMEMDEEASTVPAMINTEEDMLRVELRLHDVQSERLFQMADEIESFGLSVLPPGSKVHVIGGMFFAARVTGSIVEDLVKSLLFAFVIIFIVIVLIFRSARLGLLSVVPNLLPLLVCMGVMGLTGIRLRIATAMIFAIALGIAVDDTIHFLNRFRVERSQGRPVPDAVKATIETTGRAITQTSILLILGLSVLLAGSFKATVHFSILSTTIFASALYAALLLLPAALVAADRIFSRKK